MKLVINKCYGGFRLSEAGIRRYAALKGLTLYPSNDGRFSGLFGPTWFTVPPEEQGPFLDGEAFHKAPLKERQASNDRHAAQTLYDRDIPRDEAALVQTVEELGDAASGMCAKLKVVEIPDGLQWNIEEYDGMEWVSERHQTWG